VLVRVSITMYIYLSICEEEDSDRILLIVLHAKT